MSGLVKSRSRRHLLAGVAGCDGGKKAAEAAIASADPRGWRQGEAQKIVPDQWQS